MKSLSSWINNSHTLYYWRLFTVFEQSASSVGDPRRNTKLENNIHMSLDSSGEHDSTDRESGEEKFVDAQDSHKTQLVRSSLIRKETEWWRFESKSLLAHAFMTQEFPTCYRIAASPDNVLLCKPGIRREHNWLSKNHTWDLVDYAPGMKRLPWIMYSKLKRTSRMHVWLHWVLDKCVVLIIVINSPSLQHCLQFALC